MKKIQRVLSLRDIKSIHSVGARSIPRVQRSPYLDLYMLRKEKDRLEREIFALGERKNSGEKQLDDIDKHIKKLQSEAGQEQRVKTYKNVPTKPLKTMPVNY